MTPTPTTTPSHAARLLPALLLALLLLAPAPARASVVTNAGSAARDGWYPDQPRLSPAVVGGTDFGQLFDKALDGQIYAQPLVAAHTLVVATETNHVYGLDPVTGAIRWDRADLGAATRSSDVPCADLAPSLGVTGTPVIDVDDATGAATAYLVARRYVTGTSGDVTYEAHAIDVATGAEKPGFPLTLGGVADNNPATSFAPRTELQRPGLLLLDGVVYAAFGSACDSMPWQGWVMGFSTAGRATARWTTMGTGANWSGAGIWQAGAGLMSDGPGRIFVMTGNAGTPYQPAAGTSPPANLGQSAVRLQVQSTGALEAADFFTPAEAGSLDAWDADFGSSGITALPSAFGTPDHPHVAAVAGKEGFLYLVDRDDLGGFQMGAAAGDAVLGRFGPFGGVWSRPSAWPGDGGYLYVPTASGGTTASGTQGYLEVFKAGVDGHGLPSLGHVATSADAFGFSSGAPIVTSDGTTSGSALVWIVWAASGSGAGAQLRAYSAVPEADGAGVLRPKLVFSRPIGTSAKFAPPGVAGGTVYAGTRDGHVLAFGSPVDAPLSANALAFPTTTIGQSSTATATLVASRAVTVTALTASDPHFTLGEPASALPATLGAGDALTVPVTFAPTATGAVSGSLVAQTSAGAVPVGLTGTGQATAGVLSATPAVVSFPGTATGATRSASLTITNTGGSPVQIGALDAPAAPFTVGGVPAAGTSLAPGASVVASVSYAPAHAGSDEDQLTLHSDANALSVGLSGNAADPAHLVVDPQDVDFGDVRTGQTAERTFTVTNDGGTGVEITKSKPPAAGAGFTVTQGSLDEGTTLAPGEARTLTVAFSPTGAGAASDAWTVTAMDGTGMHTVALHGVGTAPPAPVAPASPPVAVAGAGPAPPAAVAAIAVPSALGTMPPPAPRLTRVRLIPSVFVKRTRIAFTLRGGDRVSVAYARLAAGRVLPAGRLALERARPGANLLTLVLASARGLPLRAGAYRLTVTPRAADGRAGPPVGVPFRIVPRAR